MRKFADGDTVSHYGLNGTVVDFEPSTRKYLIKQEKEGKVTLSAAYESELTKINEGSDT